MRTFLMQKHVLKILHWGRHFSTRLHEVSILNCVMIRRLFIGRDHIHTSGYQTPYATGSELNLYQAFFISDRNCIQGSKHQDRSYPAFFIS